MNYSELKLFDVANGPGIRVTLYVSGCTHHCNGCFNTVTWDFNAGKPFDEAVMDKIIDAMKASYIAGITILGGEPFEYVNQEGLLPLLKKVKETYPEKDVWCFTGYLFDKDIIDAMTNESPYTSELLKYIDVIVDGPFIEEQRNLMLKFKGSENQRTIDVQKSLKAGYVIEREGYES